MSAQKQAVFKIWRGDARGGEFRDYTTGVSEGMVVLDAVSQIQATEANGTMTRELTPIKSAVMRHIVASRLVMGARPSCAWRSLVA